MSERFDTILTNAGLAAVANATITQKQVNFAKLGVGDSNGAYYTPTQEATALRNQVWIGNASSVTTDPNNPNWIVVKAVIPGTVGGFEIRELGIFDENNVLLAIGKLPQTYKPIFSEGSTKELTIKAIFEVTNASAITLKIDPSVIYASEKYVDDKIATVVSGLENVQQQLNQHATAIDTKVDTHINDIVNHVYFGKDVGNAANSKVITIPATVPVNYPDGLAVSFRNTVTNTGPVILQVNSRANITVHNTNGEGLVAGDMVAGLIYTVRYNATRSAFQLQGESGVLTHNSASWTVPGTYYWTVPKGVYRVNYRARGAGGAGGNVGYFNDYDKRPGGGGGSGGLSVGYFDCKPGDAIRIDVGKGGNANPNLNDHGNPGGNTIIFRNNSESHLWVHGGGGGTPSQSSQSFGLGGEGGQPNRQGWTNNTNYTSDEAVNKGKFNQRSNPLGFTEFYFISGSAGRSGFNGVGENSQGGGGAGSPGELSPGRPGNFSSVNNNPYAGGDTGMAFLFLGSIGGYGANRDQNLQNGADGIHGSGGGGGSGWRLSNSFGGNGGNGKVDFFW